MLKGRWQENCYVLHYVMSVSDFDCDLCKDSEVLHELVLRICLHNINEKKVATSRDQTTDPRVTSPVFCQLSQTASHQIYGI